MDEHLRDAIRRSFDSIGRNAPDVPTEEMDAFFEKFAKILHDGLLAVALDALIAEDDECLEACERRWAERFPDRPTLADHFEDTLVGLLAESN